MLIAVVLESTATSAKYAANVDCGYFFARPTELDRVSATSSPSLTA
jgi:hypothetical protein